MSYGIPTGTSISFATSGFSGRIIETIAWDGIERGSIEKTHFGSTQAGANQIGGREFMPSVLADPGELTIVVQYDPAAELPIHKAAETITITPPAAMSSDTITGTGFCRSVRVGLPLEGLATATLVVKWSGVVDTPTA